MITNRREESDTKEVFNRRSTTDLLEREVPLARNEFVATKNLEQPSVNEDQNARMSKNFDLLLNYEKYLEKAKKEETAEAQIKTEDKNSEKIINEATTYSTVSEVKPEVRMNAEVKETDDIKPSSTTMQFGDISKPDLYSDLKNESKVKSESRFHLSTQGKVLCAIYAIVVVTIIALIIINTTVLANLKTSFFTKSDNLAKLKEQYNQLEQEYNDISSDKNVIEIAENEYNMVK